MIRFAILLTLVVSNAKASDNGKYYACDTSILDSDNQCIFALTGEQPEDWIQETVLHDINRDVGADFYRGVQSYDGETMLSVSPKPWVNGDSLVASDDPITGDLWSGYALIFELIAPLRDMMMYDPSALTLDVWAKYTRALTDCNSKTEDYVSTRGGSQFSTDQVYEYLLDPQGNDIHHFILQYLEEGTIDLVCLSTDLDMEHCDVMRETANAIRGEDRCNCWFDAYKALYGECPKFDMAFTACSGTTASVDCADEQPIDTSSLGTVNPSGEVTTVVQPVQPIVTTGAPPEMGGQGGGAKGRRFLI
jgi:hypothetical protein